jgi:DNA-binding Xre family transcriptional regulator
MAQAALLIDVLKNGLRERGLTYAHVAQGLKLSESSVKRLFAQKNLTLERLERICELMGLEIADLLEQARAAEGRLTELSEEQERALVSEPKLLLVGILALSDWTAARILQQYQFTEAELVGLLTHLERLKVIDLMPDNRIKLKLARNFAWRKGGPIQRFFEERVQREFLHASFLRERELRLTLHASLSDHSNDVLQQRIRKIAEEFAALADDDRRLGHDKRDGTTLMMAIRPFEFSMFAQLRRVPESEDSATRTDAPRNRRKRASR